MQFLQQYVPYLPVVKFSSLYLKYVYCQKFFNVSCFLSFLSYRRNSYIRSFRHTNVSKRDEYASRCTLLCQQTSHHHCYCRQLKKWQILCSNMQMQHLRLRAEKNLNIFVRNLVGCRSNDFFQSFTSSCIGTSDGNQ